MLKVDAQGLNLDYTQEDHGSLGFVDWDDLSDVEWIRQDARYRIFGKMVKLHLLNQELLNDYNLNRTLPQEYARSESAVRPDTAHMPYIFGPCSFSTVLNRQSRPLAVDLRREQSSTSVDLTVLYEIVKARRFLKEIPEVGPKWNGLIVAMVNKQIDARIVENQ